MGWIFHRRIKLGNGLGINISKSTFSPSLRTPLGTIGTKGYSVRTPIKGVYYRKRFAKKKVVSSYQTETKYNSRNISEIESEMHRLHRMCQKYNENGKRDSEAWKALGKLQALIWVMGGEKQ
ncbi:MAG: hypothetical protein AABY22_07205 [Nanoarchaeota archaeon]